MQTLEQSWVIARDPNNVGRNEHWFNAIRKEAEPAVVPGIIQQTFPDYYGVAWYWTKFKPAEAAGPDRRYLLRFTAVDYIGDAWINGRWVGGHEGGETPFWVDATDAIRPDGENLLAVRVLNPTDEPIDGIKLAQIPHRNKCAKDYTSGRSYNSGGILRPVELHVLPHVRITDIFARPDCTTGQIRTQVTVRNDTPGVVAGTLAAAAGPGLGGDVLSATSSSFEFTPGDSVHVLVLKIDEFRRWNLDDPNLYRVTISLDAAGKYCHEQMIRCGFREFKVEKGYFRLNGKRIFLKSTHTGNHMPMGQVTPMDPDLMRRDFLMAKVAGYNCVRFIAGMGWAEQMDFCDEIGLMVYEECLAGWCLEDSPDMKRRFDLSVREMILRDRNHPSITIWGLLNETPDGAVFRHAVDSLVLVRSLDDTRLVLLGSGRWDCQPSIGSLSNPGGDTWEHQWGIEGPDAKAVINTWDINHGGYFDRMGDAHVYPGTPHPPATIKFLRTLGHDTKPVFLSEYGTGSMLDVVRGTRWYEQFKARPDLNDYTMFRTMAEKLQADWKKWGFEGTYAFTGDLLRDSQRLHTRQRLLGFDLIRSNPKICGFNLTGILDHGISGEGVWTFFREWKPGTAEALADGWAPLRWCLFADPTHGYSGGKFKLEAVLANEDVLGPGEYPVTFSVHGPGGTVWKKSTTVKIPKPKPGVDGPLAIPVLAENVKLKAPAGTYEFSAYLEKGGAPFGGRVTFHVSEPAVTPKVKPTIRLWGLDKKAAKWLAAQGVKAKPFTQTDPKKREVILVGTDPSIQDDSAGWQALTRQVAQGSFAVFFNPKIFQRKPGGGKVGRLNRIGNFKTSLREFEVPNVPKEDWIVFSKEFWENIHYEMTGLPNGEYTIELGMCEGHLPHLDTRVFDVAINGEKVLEQFDLVKEAGGFHRAAIRSFKARPIKGKIEIRFLPIKGATSLSRLRIYNAKNELIAEDRALDGVRDTMAWLPLPKDKKGRTYEFGDWLYHKECVAKAHPIFNGLQAKGIMDWDYYGPVVSHTLLEGQADPDEVIVAAFAAGYCTPGGYASGLMMTRYNFGAGGFLINTLNILDNVGTHPAADRLLINMIQYGASQAQKPAAKLPKNFGTILKGMDYLQ